MPSSPASKRALLSVLWGLFLACLNDASAQTTTDLYSFFAEEAQVVSASRIPQAPGQEPATVYVITGEELRSSGAATLWDALRLVPGVDVMTVRTFQGSVSIRGLNKTLNSRTLVLVDSRSTTAVSVDYSFWESLPVLLEEVERVEIVQGPASALYGANAIAGVVNIITKRPGQVNGTRFDLGMGEYRSRRASLLWGRQEGRMGYKLGAGWHRGNSFEDPGRKAGDALKIVGHLSYDLGAHTQLSLSGGRTRMDTEVSGARFNRLNTDGSMGFLRLDGVHRHTRLRLFWNTADIMVNFRAYDRMTSEKHDVWDLNLEQLIPLSRRSTAVVGGGFRDLTLKSSYVAARSSLWSLFAEHQWRPFPRWTLWSSARLDAKPRSGPGLSPRFSLTFKPLPAHALRLSAGGAYRNPTLLDRHLVFTDTLRVGELVAAVVNKGNPELQAERIQSFELAHLWVAGRFTTRATVFGYRLDHPVQGVFSSASSPEPRHFDLVLTYRNLDPIDAWGGEGMVAFPLGQLASGFANYSYQDLRGSIDQQAAGRGTPHHKLNGGVRWRRGGLQGSAACSWVSRTLWLNQNPLVSTYRPVPGYTLVSLHLGYAFAGRLWGLTLSLDAFNLLDRRHYETLPAASALEPGQSAEVVRARRGISLIYQL